MIDHVSYSYLHLLVGCPYAAYLRYQKAIRLPPTPWLALGKTLHSAIEHQHKAESWNLDLAVSEFSSSFKTQIEEEEIFIGYPQLRKLEAEGIEMLGGYYEDIRIGNVQEHPLDVEKEFEIEIGGVKVVGVIDRVEEDNGLVISDNKSGKEKPKEWNLSHDIQGTTYWIACKEIYGEYPRKFVWHHLRTRDFLPSTRTQTDIDNLHRMVENAAKFMELGIRHRVYHDKICGRCDYQGEICDDPSLEVES